MAINSSITARAAEVIASCTPSGSFRWFLFGSAQHSDSPRDVDLLLIYPDGELESAHAAAECVRAADATGMYEVLAASESEERCLDLIRLQNGSPIQVA